MNMLRQMDRQPHTYLLIFFCFTFISIYGKHEDLSPSCDVDLMVRRNTILKTVPRQSLTVECPVQHCGELLNVTWCKLLKGNHCEWIKKTENIEMRQKNNSVKHELISYLTFKNISIHDDGLYRCALKGYKYELISHKIHISVSDLHPVVENFHINEAIPMSSDGYEPFSWLPYFYICVGMALLVTILIVLNHLHFYGWKRTLTYKPTNGQEMSNFMIPDLPRRSDPTTQDNFSILNDIYLSSTGTRHSPPSLITSGNRPLANTANGNQLSDYRVYADINHKQSMLPARKHHMETKQDKNTEYATISVS